MARIFGFLGALAAVFYVVHNESTHAVATAGWLARAPKLLIYAAVGFAIGWFVGLLLSKVGRD